MPFPSLLLTHIHVPLRALTRTHTQTCTHTHTSHTHTRTKCRNITQLCSLLFCLWMDSTARLGSKKVLYNKGEEIGVWINRYCFCLFVSNNCSQRKLSGIWLVVDIDFITTYWPGVLIWASWIMFVFLYVFWYFAKRGSCGQIFLLNGRGSWRENWGFPLEREGQYFDQRCFCNTWMEWQQGQKETDTQPLIFTGEDLKMNHI